MTNKKPVRRSDRPIDRTVTPTSPFMVESLEGRALMSAATPSFGGELQLTATAPAPIALLLPAVQAAREAARRG